MVLIQETAECFAVILWRGRKSMSAKKFRGLALACGAAMMLLAVPGEGKACCFLDGLFGGCCGGA